MKILVDGRVIKHKYPTGVEKYTYKILETFNRLQLEYDVLTPSLPNKYYQHIWEHTILPLKSKRYDILFCPANISPIWKLNRTTKLVTVIHDLGPLNFPQFYSKFFSVYYRLLLPTTMKNSDIIITHSESMKKEFISRYPEYKEKIRVIYEGLTDKFLNLKIEPSNRKKNYILYVGALQPRKNLKGVILAFSKILDKIPHKLFIVGTTFNIFARCKEIDEIIKKITKERIVFLGYIKTTFELIELYKNATCLIFPSFYEGFGLPPLEAMACGCPVIVSNIPSLVEVCGDAAYYVDPYDVEDISEGIQKLVVDNKLRESLIIKGLQRAKLFPWENTINGILKIFREIAFRGNQ